MDYIIYLFFIFVAKVFDNLITTSKSILVQKNKAMAASIMVALSQFIFYILIKQVVADDNFITVVIVSVASGIGAWIAFFINKKLSKETVYVNIITANDIEHMKQFGDYMRQEDIKIVTFKAYNDDIEETLTAIVFANTKEQSSKIDEYMNAHEGYHREVV